MLYTSNIVLLSNNAETSSMNASRSLLFLSLKRELSSNHSDYRVDRIELLHRRNGADNIMTPSHIERMEDPRLPYACWIERQVIPYHQYLEELYCCNVASACSL